MRIASICASRGRSAIRRVYITNKGYDIIEQMRNEAQFLVDRAADQRAVSDAAEPLYTSLDDKQKQIFIDEMVRLSRERGLD